MIPNSITIFCPMKMLNKYNTYMYMYIKCVSTTVCIVSRDLCKPHVMGLVVILFT